MFQYSSVGITLFVNPTCKIDNFLLQSTTFKLKVFVSRKVTHAEKKIKSLWFLLWFCLIWTFEIDRHYKLRNEDKDLQKNLWFCHDQTIDLQKRINELQSVFSASHDDYLSDHVRTLEKKQGK